MDDVKFSIERAAGLIEGVESTSITAFYTALDSVEVIDDYTGRLVFKEPSVTLVEQALPLTGIISRKAYEEKGVEGFQREPIGTGPYELAEVVAGRARAHDQLHRVRRPGAVRARASGTTSWCSRSSRRTAPPSSPTRRVTSTCWRRCGPRPSIASTRSTTPSISEGAGMQYRFIGMNMIDPALANPDLRNAIIAAIDVPSILTATSEGRDVRATALVAPSAPIGYWEDAPVHEQDLDEARRLVELVPEADRSLRFTIGDDEISRTVAQVAQANLEDAGLTVEIEILDPATFFVADETNRERQLFYTEYGINYREPSQELVWFTCDQFDIWNYVYFCDEEYDRLFAEAAARARRRRPQRDVRPDAGDLGGGREHRVGLAPDDARRRPRRRRHRGRSGRHRLLPDAGPDVTRAVGAANGSR